jgi:predicted P-loop ATPase
VRLELFDKGKRVGKTFRQRRPDGRGGWTENLRGLSALPPYRLRQLLASRDQGIHLCEGEKDSDTLARLGLASTSFDAPSTTDLSVFQGRIIFIHEDNDRAGREKSSKKVGALQGIAAEMRIVRYPDAGEGGDVSDWLAKIARGEQLEQLLARCGEADRSEARPHASAEKSGSRSPIDWPEIGKSNSPRGRSQPNIQAFLKWRDVELAHNAFTMRELATVDGKEREVDDDLLRALWLEADRLGLSAPEKFFVSVVLDLAHQLSFHPVREYLDALRWDGKPRLDQWLVTYAGAADAPLVRAFGSKHLLAAVLRIRQPGAKHDAMLVLEGPQGIGKSSLIRALAGDNWFSDALAVGEESRKVIELTSGVWLGEIAELKGLGNREAEQVKAMLSRQSDRARLAYGRLMTDRPRQFVLFGSVNDSQYLRDLTGNRRFWPVRCGTIDEVALRQDRDQIWAEAAHRQAQGESIELPPDLWAAAAAEQEQRVLTDPWQVMLEPLLEGKTGHIEIAQINQRLGLEAKHQNGQVGQRIAAIMTRLGFARTRLRRNRARVYAYSNVKLNEGELATWIELRSSPDTPSTRGNWGRD